MSEAPLTPSQKQRLTWVQLFEEPKGALRLAPVWHQSPDFAQMGRAISGQRPHQGW
jgi:hypothetical protein